jgi:hypothetical protein
VTRPGNASATNSTAFFAGPDAATKRVERREWSRKKFTELVALLSTQPADLPPRPRDRTADRDAPFRRKWKTGVRGLVNHLAGHGRSRRTKRWHIPAQALLIRYPDGDFEYDFIRQALPVIGDTVRGKGERWRVTRLVESGVLTAYVERVEQTQRRPPSPPT